MGGGWGGVLACEKRTDDEGGHDPLLPLSESATKYTVQQTENPRGSTVEGRTGVLLVTVPDEDNWSPSVPAGTGEPKSQSK